MIFKDLYQRYLASPRTASLAADVALNYIPTTIKVEGADAVLHHLTRQDHVIKTKSETILDAVEGNASICVDVETTVEFVSGGGAYLPSLDDNFLSDRVATFPTVCTYDTPPPLTPRTRWTDGLTPCHLPRR